MSEWQSHDEVITTFGTIQQAAKENFEIGRESERQRIIAMLEELLERVKK